MGEDVSDEEILLSFSLFLGGDWGTEHLVEEELDVWNVFVEFVALMDHSEQQFLDVKVVVKR